METLQQKLEEFNNLFADKIEQSINFTYDVKQNADNLYEINRDYCFRIAREAVQFNEQEYEDYVSTGKSPKLKENKKLEKIIDLKTNEELLENFKLSNNSFKQPTYLKEESSNSISFHSLTDISRTTKNESQPNFKRGISDRENIPDFSEKAFKVKRLGSNSRLKTSYD